MRDFDNEAFDLRGEGKPGVGALEVISRGIQSNSTLTNRFLFYQYDIVNKSSSTIRGGRFGILVDPDHPAHLETEYGDDSAEFVSSLNLAVSYDYDNNYSEWPGVDLAYMGIQFLKSPTDSDGQLLGMTSWKSFTYGRMPQSGEIGGVLYKSRDEAQYDYMKPGVFSPSPQVNKDIVYVMASGDFTIAPKDTQSVVVAILTADSREQLIKTAEAALAVFNNDFKTQANLMSTTGTYNANSDGSFFRYSENVSADDLENNMGSQSSSLNVKYPETISLSDDVVLARYYLEGVISDDGGTVNNYRTRVTHIWVKEKSGWKTKSWHFSPLHDGGRHITSSSDFEED